MGGDLQVHSVAVSSKGKAMIGPISRIVLRYVAGALIAHGVVDMATGTEVANNADVLELVQLGVGAAIGIGTELWYALAKRYGWAK